MTQFAVIAIAPAEHLTLRSEGQRVAIGALGRRHLLDGTVGFEGQLLERGLVVRVPEAQAAVASLPASPDGAVGRDYKSAVLACLDLQRRGEELCVIEGLQADSAFSHAVVIVALTETNWQITAI